MTDQATALATARSGGLVALTGANNPFLKLARDEGVTDGLYLRLNGKTGKFVSNYPGIAEFAPGTEFVFNLYEAIMLWTGFDKDNKPYNGPQVAIKTGQPLPDHPEIEGVKWIRQLRVMVAGTDGGKPMALTSKADNPFRASLKLVKKFGEEVAKYPDPSSPNGYMMPIVKIESSERDTKKKEEVVRVNPKTGAKEIVEEENKINFFVEDFAITDWITQAEMDQIKADAGDAEDNTPAAGAGALAAPQQTIAAPVAPAPAPAAAVSQPAPVGVVEGVHHGEIIAPAQTVAAPAAANGFRRNRAGGRTA